MAKFGPKCNAGQHSRSHHAEHDGPTSQKVTDIEANVSALSGIYFLVETEQFTGEDYLSAEHIEHK